MFWNAKWCHFTIQVLRIADGSGDVNFPEKSVTKV